MQVQANGFPRDPSSFTGYPATLSNQKLGFLNQPFPKLLLFIFLVSEFLNLIDTVLVQAAFNYIQGTSASLTCTLLFPSMTRPLHQLCPSMTYDLSNYCSVTGCLSLTVCCH